MSGREVSGREVSGRRAQQLGDGGGHRLFGHRRRVAGVEPERTPVLPPGGLLEQVEEVHGGITSQFDLGAEGHFELAVAAVIAGETALR